MHNPIQDIPIDLRVYRNTDFLKRQQVASLERKISRDGVVLYAWRMVKVCTNEFRLSRILMQHETNSSRGNMLSLWAGFRKAFKSHIGSVKHRTAQTHDLIVLCKKCTELDSAFATLAEACIELSPYGVQTRYPSNLDLSTHDMQCALSMCHLIDKFVREKLPPLW